MKEREREFEELKQQSQSMNKKIKEKDQKRRGEIDDLKAEIYRLYQKMSEADERIESGQKTIESLIEKNANSER